MGFSLRKLNPFDKDNFDPGRALLAIGTGGLSVGVEAGVELTGEALKKAKADKVVQDSLAASGMMRNVGAGQGLTGNQPAPMSKPQQEATREIFDPRRRRNSSQNFGSLTTGQFDSQPSLIG